MSKKNKKKNMLNEWEEQIKAFPRLNIEDARKIYLEALNTSDEFEKKALLNEVIQGTLYVVANFIKSNKLKNIRSVGYDIEDIINTCNELWIKAIYKGELLEVDAFSKILDTTFCFRLSDSLKEADLEMIDLTFFTAPAFVSVLYDFIEYEKQYGSVSFKEFCKLIAKYYDIDRENFYPYVCSRINGLAFSDSDFAQQSYELFQNIIDAIKDENDNIEITKKKIEKLKYLLMDIGVEGFRVNIDSSYMSDFSDRLVNHMIFSDLVKDVFENSELDDRKKELLNRFFGLNGYDRLDVKPIANIYRISEARAYQLRNKALKSLRKNPKILKYYQFYKEQQ